MATFPRFVASVTVVDGALRPSTWSCYVPQATAQAYVAAADDAARAATALGVLFAAVEALMSGSVAQRGVGIEVVIDPVANPADDILRGNKLSFGVRSAGRGLTMTVPTRKTGAYTQKSDSIEIELATPAAMNTFRSAYEGTAVDMFGNSVSIQDGKVVD